MNNKIVVFYNGFDFPVQLKSESPDISRTSHEGGELVMETLDSYAGLGHFFDTIPGVKYQVVYKGLKIGTMTANDKLKIAVEHIGNTDPNITLRSDVITADGDYTLEYVAVSDKSFTKIYTESHTKDHELKLDALSISVEDPLQDFNEITNSNKQLILDNLQVNVNVSISKLACMDLKKDDYDAALNILAHIHDVWFLSNDIKSFNSSSANAINAKYNNLQKFV